MSPTRVFLFLGVGLFAGAAVLTCVSTAPVRAQPQRTANPYVERLEPFIEKTLREEKIPGLAIGIVENGKLVYSRGFGVMNWATPLGP